MNPFSDEQLRTAVNLAQFHGAWLQASRRLGSLPYGMTWKHSGGYDYLYELTDRGGNGRSLGRRSPETETQLAAYREQKLDATERARAAWTRLTETARILRALRAPSVAGNAAAILREAALRSMLGTDLLAVGTTAIVAYQYEAAHYFAPGLDATADFDLAWRGARGLQIALAYPSASSVFALLKAVDSTYTVNSERPFQARNREAYEVELLVAPSVAKTLPPGERLRPVPMPEQEWLLKGRPVSQVVPASDATAALITAPDPRWFALHKLWLADKPGRDPLKAPKDRRQGRALLQAIREQMPQYPLDDSFMTELPPQLAGYLEQAG
jgi:hypothetical protein